MLAVDLNSPGRIVAYLLAGLGAGISNGIAGGGTFITFPTLLAAGIPALQANVTSSVGVVASYAGGLGGFRRQVATQGRQIARLVPGSIVGVAVGTEILLHSSSAAFRSIVPWLILIGTVLFAAAPIITQRLAHRTTHGQRHLALQVGNFAIAVYGGYFGAGVGILLLALFALTLDSDMATHQGLRSAISLIMNGTAALIFTLRGHLVGSAVLCLLIGTLAGGMLGTVLIKRLSPQWVRGLIVATGLITVVRLLSA
jgi:uncharacterized membrane protein YfcA